MERKYVCMRHDLKYDTILFDADGTLFDFLKSEREAIIETFLSLGITPDDAMVSRYSQINDGLWKMLERGEIEKNVLLYRRFELFFEEYHIEADAQETAKRYMNALSQKCFLLDCAEELCRRLSECFRLYIVTNGVEFIQQTRYERSGLGRYFQDIFISGVIGYEKPSEKYFEYVAKRVPSFDPKRTVIVGDSLTSDMRGGLAAGIDTCWYNPQGKPLPEEMRGKLTFVAHSMDEIYDYVTGGEKHDHDDRA